jgi:hypothetical protein
MSNLLVRLLLAILLIPLAALFYLVVQVLTDRMDSISRETSFILGGIAMWCVAAPYWIMLWRGTVLWTMKRRIVTLLVALGSSVVAVAIGVVIKQIMGGDQFGTFVGSIAAPLFWLVGTVFAWRESSDERIQRLRAAGTKVLVCPGCGYNLTGLKEARCPECGLQMTLDQLVAAQPRESSAELSET